LATIVQNESGEFMFNLEFMRKEGNVSVTRFRRSHENEGGVGFGRVDERYDLWFFEKLSGCDFCNQGIIGADIFNGSTVSRVVRVGLVKSTPDHIFGHRHRKMIMLRMRRLQVGRMGSIWRIEDLRGYLTFYVKGP